MRFQFFPLLYRRVLKDTYVLLFQPAITLQVTNECISITYLYLYLVDTDGSWWSYEQMTVDVFTTITRL